MARSIFEAPDTEIARKCLHDALEAFKIKAPKIKDLLEYGFVNAQLVTFTQRSTAYD